MSEAAAQHPSNISPPDAARDKVIAFHVTERDARGRIARLEDSLSAILAAHDYPDIYCRLLGEALILTTLIGTALQKNEGQTTLQAQAKNGAVDLLVCDYRAGELRGYLSFDEAGAVPDDGAKLGDIFGEGYLAISIDQSATADRYQGVVPLEGSSLSEAAEAYFAQSEQIPTLVRTALAPAKGGGWVGGGLLLQYLPQGEEDDVRLTQRPDISPDWEHILALGGSITGDELTDDTLDLDALLWRLFNEDEVRVMPTVGLSRGCRCSQQRIREVISRFSAEDIADMRDDSGKIEVNCEFCNKKFPVEI